MSSKRYRTLIEKVDSSKKYSIDEGLKLISEMSGTKFDQSVDVALRLGVDPKKSDQQVRGAVPLPHGLGKKVSVLVFAKAEKEQEAKGAGADYVGTDDLIKKVSGGWMDFDKVVATPDMMGAVSRLGKVLGPRGLMPNPKTGTVTFDVAKAVKELKSGKAEFRTEKAAIIHCSIGKVSFGPEKLKDNLVAFLEAVHKLKPASAKGNYFRSLAFSPTLSPSVRIDVAEAEKLV